MWAINDFLFHLFSSIFYFYRKVKKKGVMRVKSPLAESAIPIPSSFRRTSPSSGDIAK
jgi:hypothetical protein